MNDTDIVDLIAEAIATIAPEVDPHDVRSDADLWAALELDSMDQLTVMTAVGEQLGVDIPDTDLTGLRSYDALVAYLLERSTR